MPRLPLVVLAMLAALVALPAAAPAKARVGISDNNPRIFTQPSFHDLEPQFVRKIVPIDTISKGGSDLNDLDAYMAAARALGLEVLVSFNPTRRHFTPGRSKKADLPSTRAFKRAFRAFRARYPYQRVFSPWNEINSPTQPTAYNAKRAAQFSNIANRLCRSRCKIVAGDFLDISNMARYFKKFRSKLNFRPKYWGLHNYGDTNRFRSRYTRQFLRLTRRGQVWMTETGGLAKFCKLDGTCDFPYDEARQARAIRQMFKLTKLSRRLTRIYIYEFFGKPASERFDAGLVNPDGSKRAAYHSVKARTNP